jgi:hypothetical protein
MNMSCRGAFVLMLLSCSMGVARAQPTQPAAMTDIYHVYFAKAAPGQAAALAEQLQKFDPKAPMAGHFVLLRHQEGDDWDYCLIQHVGPKAAVEITGPTPATPLTAWHTDTFVAGPGWGEFSKQMGLGAAAGQTAGSVYVVGVHRAVPGHRDQLLAALGQTDPASKVPVSQLLLTHVEGGPWQFMSLQRFNSWQDFAASQAAPGGGTADGWTQIREHSAYHTDTLADRIYPK